MNKLTLYLLALFAVFVISGSGGTVTHFPSSDPHHTLSNTLEYYLCHAGNNLKSNTTVVLSSNTTHFISAGNFCTIENKEDLRIVGNATPTSPYATIECLDNETADSRGFGFFNVTNLSLVNLQFQKCGGRISEEAVRHVNESLLYYEKGQKAAILLNHCINLHMENVSVVRSRGFALVTANLLGFSFLKAITILYGNFAVKCNDVTDFSCSGSGAFFYYQDSIIIAQYKNTTSVLEVMESTIGNNFGHTPDTFSSFTLQKALENGERIPILGGSDLSFIAVQSTFTVNIQVSKICNSNHPSLNPFLGSVFIMFSDIPSMASAMFDDCYFISGGGPPLNIYIIKVLSAVQMPHHNNETNKNAVLVFEDCTISSFGIASINIAGFSKPSKGYSNNLTIVFNNLISQHHGTFGGIGPTMLACSVPDYIPKQTLHIAINNLYYNQDPWVLAQYLQSSFEIRNLGSFMLNGSKKNSNIFNGIPGPIFHMTGTDLHLAGHMHFSNISGSSALLLEGGAHVVLHEPLNVTFDNCISSYGGAIFSVQPDDRLCTFQFVTKHTYTLENISDAAINVTFNENKAYTSGASVYAFPLYTCSLYEGSNIVITAASVNVTHTLQIYKSLFHFKNSSLEVEMPSLPVKLCVCDPLTGKALSCQVESPVAVFTYPGRTFSLWLTALDDNDQPTYFQLMAQLSSKQSRWSPITSWKIGAGQDIRQLTKANGSSCAEVRYTIHASSDIKATHYLYLAASSYPQHRIRNKCPLTIQACPIGFELNVTEGTCNCVYLFKKHNINCDIDTLSISHPANSWIGVMNGTALGYALRCPPGYCKKDINKIVFSTQAPDILCTGKRTGILCGQCTNNHSVTFGSTECRQCSNLWLGTVVLYAVSGLVLVFLLFALHLTIASGRINGVIFYANILSINLRLFFGHPSLKFLLVFFSLLNLNLGIPLCFYDGMTDTVKAELQFAFPIYVWIIVIAIILLSRYSTRITRFTAYSSLAIKVLATLIHLSFSKLLNTVVDILVFTTIEIEINENSYTRNVWYYDGSISYLSTNHTILFSAAVVTAVLFIIPYIVILSGIRYFHAWKAINRLKPLIDVYTAPYKIKWEWWFGARLFLLLLVYIIYSILQGHNAPLMTFLQALILLSFTAAQAYIKPFKSQGVNIIDLFFMINYLLLATSVIFLHASEGSTQLYLAAGITTTSAFLAFWGIVLYHIGLATHCNAPQKLQALWRKWTHKGCEPCQHQNGEERDPIFHYPGRVYRPEELREPLLEDYSD